MKNKTTKTLKYECHNCNGTGLFHGMFEGPGVAVICYTCRGSGCATLSYKPFTKRKHKPGIKNVYDQQLYTTTTYSKWKRTYKPR